MTAPTTPVPSQSTVAPLKTSNNNPPSSLQDVVTTVLALSISLITLVLLIICFHSASNSNQAVFSNEKDILNLALTTFGVVIGYYFGRAPAEKQAQQATQAASQIQIQLNQQQQQTIDATVHSRASQDAAKQAQDQSSRIKAEVVRELAALAQQPTGAPGGRIAPLVSPDILGSDTMTPEELQKRMADLLDPL